MTKSAFIAVLALVASVLVACRGASERPGEVPTDTVAVAVDQFGIGSVIRPGDFTALRVRLSSGLAEATDAWVQWEVQNADGDIAEYGRRISLTPGGETRVWLYAKLPPDTTPESTWPVRVFEWRDGERRAEIGGALVSPNPSVTPIAQGAPLLHRFASLIAIVGDSDLGLRGYTYSGSPIGNNMMPTYTANEDTRLAAGIRPTQLPDRWEGLQPFEAIVWADGDPADAGLGAAAVIEYVRRGGHLVIVVPPQQDPWGLESPLVMTEFDELLPEAAPRTDMVSLEELRSLLTKGRAFNDSELIKRIRLPVKVFKDLRGDFDAIEGSAFVPLLASDDGRVVAIQRSVGHGHLTLLGFRPTQGMASVRIENGLAGVPEADMLWNRVLGRRIDTPSPAGELKALDDAKRLALPTPNQVDLGGGTLVADKIALTQQATQGLLLAIVLFLAYFGTAWLSYGYLRHLRKEQFSWLVFAGSAAVFTALAWGGVSLISSHRVQVNHLTFLDHVAGSGGSSADPQLQRAVGWFSAYLPGYGKTNVTIDSPNDQRNLVVSWTPPGVERTLFTNVDRYLVDVANRPNSIDVPTRSTSSQFYANWLGNLEMDWGSPFRQLEPPQVIRDASGREVELKCTLMHELPGDLSRVVYVWVRGQRPRPPRYTISGERELPYRPTSDSGAMTILGNMFADDAGDPWAAGQERLISIRADVGRTLLARSLTDMYYDPFDKEPFNPLAGVQGHERDFLEMLCFFNMLQPPVYMDDTGGRQPPASAVQVTRKLGRELDLSPWMARPSLIILGFLEDSPIPIPLRIDGEKPESTGLTIVRWICPLPIEEDVVFQSQLAEAE